MKRRRSVRVLTVLVVLTLVAACGGRDDNTDSSSGGGGGSEGGGEESALIDTANCPDTQTAGIEGDTIKIVSSFPQSGSNAPFSQISKGWKSYIEMTNDAGGVEINGKKYKIETEDKDDTYDASKTATNIDELVGPEGDKAFAVFQVVGTANNIAIRQTLGDLCVPNVFAASGAPAWGDVENFPWMHGATNPSYAMEAQAFANYLEEAKPDAKIAMLVQDDDFGTGYRESLESAIEGTDLTIVATETYSAGTVEIESQMTSLKASGADAFFDGATLLACPTALKSNETAGWKPITYVSGTCISKTLMGVAGTAAEDVISVTNIKDPIDPAYAEDEEMQLYRETVAKYQPDADLDNGIVTYGWTQGALLINALENVEGDLTRLSFMESLRTFDEVSAGLVLDGITLSTGPEDHFLAETVQVVQYDSTKKYFDKVGELFDLEGKVTDVTPENLITG